MNKTLLIMAAGLGSRYGGNKQVDRLGPHGEILMEYSIHDALLSGFNKVVFVVRKAMLADFREMVGDRIGRKCDVAYACQEFDSLPDGFVPPSGRTKPYGTAHAVLCARNCIDEPFAVLNADDYYGRDAFAGMAASLSGMAPTRLEASMVAYDLKNTVSANGGVTRGICKKDEAGHLLSVTETYQIRLDQDGLIREYGTNPSGSILPPDALVSMNFFGFTPALFPELERHLSQFLHSEEGDPMKKEYLLPTVVDALMKEKGLQVDVLNTHATWFGVTYQEDRPLVVRRLKELHETGFYPEII